MFGMPFSSDSLVPEPSKPLRRCVHQMDQHCIWGCLRSDQYWFWWFLSFLSCLVQWSTWWCPGRGLGPGGSQQLQNADQPGLSRLCSPVLFDQFGSWLIRRITYIVNDDRSWLELNHPKQSGDQRGLAGPCPPHNSHLGRVQNIWFWNILKKIALPTIPSWGGFRMFSSGIF